MNGPLFAWEDKVPLVHPTAWIAPTAAVIGDVEIGADSNIWFHCVLRGDNQPIRIGVGTNIQDGSVLHISSPNLPCIIGDHVTIGHAAIVHAAILKNHAFVGMGATVLDGAVIEERGMLAAGGLLTPGKVIGPGELWAGAPARLMRIMGVAEMAHFALTAPHYVQQAQRFKLGLRAVTIPRPE